MPTKKAEKQENVLKNAKKTASKKNVKVINTEKKVSTAKKSTATIKKSATAKRTSSTSKKSTKSAVKKVTSATKKKTTAKNSKAKATASKSVGSKSVAKKKTTTKNKSLINADLTQEFSISEYYDLPAKYEKTVVKLLAQTPKTLFVYWDISDEDRTRLINTYGPSFFYDTKPVLIITNKTKNYTFEVDINDFANCWYLHVNDAKCEYHVELGRRSISSISLPNNYLYIASSNEIEAPNDHILFENKQNMVYFKNVKTNQVSSKPITTFTLLHNLGKFYNIYDFYKEAYKEDFSTASKLMGNSSSVFK